MLRIVQIYTIIHKDANMIIFGLMAPCFFTLIKIKIILKSHQKHILSEGVIIGRFYAT